MSDCDTGITKKSVQKAWDYQKKEYNKEMRKIKKLLSSLSKQSPKEVASLRELLKKHIAV